MINSVGSENFISVGISSSEFGLLELIWKPWLTRKSIFAGEVFPGLTAATSTGATVTYCCCAKATVESSATAIKIFTIEIFTDGLLGSVDSELHLEPYSLVRTLPRLKLFSRWLPLPADRRYRTRDPECFRC